MITIFFILFNFAVSFGMSKAYERDINLQFFFKKKTNFLICYSLMLLLVQLLLYYRSFHQKFSKGIWIYTLFLMPLLVLLLDKINKSRKR